MVSAPPSPALVNRVNIPNTQTVSLILPPDSTFQSLTKSEEVGNLQRIFTELQTNLVEAEAVQISQIISPGLYNYINVSRYVYTAIPVTVIISMNSILSMC